MSFLWRTPARRAALYTLAGTTAAIGTGVLYVNLRPRRPLPHGLVPPVHSAPPHFPQLPTRTELLKKLKDEENNGTEYDLVIIGAGATGSGIALDAASRGYKVAVLERDDFSSGTSSKSTKLVHGGVRYLEKAVFNLDWNQYLLVKEALSERNIFLHTAPHLSMSLPIMIPVYKWWQAPYFWAGTKAYDLLAGRENLESSYYLSRGKALEKFPMLKRDNLLGALVYYDGSHNDSRMNVSIAMTAEEYGATVLNHTEVVGLDKNEAGQIVSVRYKDSLPGGKAAGTIRTKGVINATGPFSDAVRLFDDPTVTPIVAPSSGVHIVLPGYYSPSDMGLIDPSTTDGRVIFFLPWQGNTIAGTTDAPSTISRNPEPSEADITWILNEISTYLAPDINVRRGDVLAAWSGIRPLVKDPKAKNTESLVRNHLVDISKSGLVTVAGGKWTTYRQMAQDAVDAAAEHFHLTPDSARLGRAGTIAPAPAADSNESYEINDVNLNSITIDGTCQTSRLRLIGAHGYSRTLFISLVQHHGLETEVAQHLAHNYGDRAWSVASLCAKTWERFPVRGLRLSKLYPYVDGEVRYACRAEMACSAVDVLARRTRLAFLNAQAALEAAPAVIDLMAEELGWDRRRKELEWDATVEFLGSMGLPEILRGVKRREVEREGGVAALLKERFPQTRGLYSRQVKPESAGQSGISSAALAAEAEAKRAPGPRGGSI